MDLLDENNPQSINETYKIWKHNVPFLYNVLQVFQLPSCSQTIDWIPESFLSDSWELGKLVIGSNSFTKNYITILNIAIPTEQTLVDYTSYKQTPPSGNICTLGQRQLNTYRSFPQNGQIMKIRVSRATAGGAMLAACVGGESFQYFVYDATLSPELVEKNKISLNQHESEGFGLDWHPEKQNLLTSGAFDKKICLWDIAGKSSCQVKPIKVIEYTSAIEDVKWFKKEDNLLASASQDKCVCIWDIRQTCKKAAISRVAHNGEVYSIDINKFNPYLLLSGGDDSDINLWDTRNMGKSLHKFIGHNDAVTKVEWSTKNPAYFSSSSFDRKLVTWNMKKIGGIETDPQNQLQFIHGGHRSSILDFSWNQKGTICASTEQQNILHVWQMNDKIRQE